MPDKAITVDEILTSAPHYDHEAHTALRRRLSVDLAGHAAVCFETRATALAFLQSLIALEGLSCPVSLAAECDEAARLWQWPAGQRCLTLTLQPHASMSPGQLCAKLAAPMASLCLDVAGILCPVHLEGPLTPRVQGFVHLSEAAQAALRAPDVAVAFVWSEPAPHRVAVPKQVLHAWQAAA